MGNTCKKFHTCSGPSMYPVIKNGNTVEYEFNDISIGDIILFRYPTEKYSIIHRIIEIFNDTLITRGDNNNKPDPFSLQFENIIGRIETITRKGKIKKNHGNRKGFLIHKFTLMRKTIVNLLKKPLRNISRLIEKIKLFNILHCFFKTVIIKMETKNGSRELLILNGKVIGNCAAEGKWKIKFPYKFFINKSKIKSKKIKIPSGIKIL